MKSLLKDLGAGSGLSPGSCDKSGPSAPCRQGTKTRPTFAAAVRESPTCSSRRLFMAPPLSCKVLPVMWRDSLTGPWARMPAAPRPRTQHVLMGLLVLESASGTSRNRRKGWPRPSYQFLRTWLKFRPVAKSSLDERREKGLSRELRPRLHTRHVASVLERRWPWAGSGRAARETELGAAPPGRVAGHTSARVARQLLCDQSEGQIVDGSSPPKESGSGSCAGVAGTQQGNLSSALF